MNVDAIVVICQQWWQDIMKCNQGPDVVTWLMRTAGLSCYIITHMSLLSV